jgi:uncharacterized protein YidB (DUF937 family)
MGLLDQIIGGVLGSRGRGGLGGAIGGRGGMSPLMMALMALLASRATGNDGGLGGVLGNVLGGGQPGGAHSGGGLSGEALRDMVRGGPAAGIGANPPGIDTSVLHPTVAGGVSDPGAALGSSGPTDDMGGGFGGGAGGLGGVLGGGLGSLIDRFTRSGREDVIGSWIGSGENRAIDPRELHEVLGEDAVEALTRETGMPREELLSELSDTLPQVVDRLTPEGRLPHDDEMGRWV